MNNLEIERVLRAVYFPGYTFILSGAEPELWLQASFMAPCNHEGGQPQEQKTRKWKLSPHMTKSEIVQTAFKCCLTSVEHEAREQFKYRGQPIFGPHYDVDVLADLCFAGGHEEVRTEPTVVTIHKSRGVGYSFFDPSSKEIPNVPV